MVAGFFAVVTVITVGIIELGVAMALFSIAKGIRQIRKEQTKQAEQSVNDTHVMAH